MYPRNEGPEPPGLSVKDLLDVLRRRLLLIAGTVAVLVILAVAYTATRTPIYESSVEILLAPSSADSVLNDRSTADPDRAVQTEIRVIKSRLVKQEVSERLGRPVSVDVVASREADVVELIASDPDPDEAARAADVYAQSYIDVSRRTFADSVLAAGAEVQTKIDEVRRELTELEQPLRALDEEISGTPPGPQRDALLDDRQRLDDELAPRRNSLLSRQTSYEQQLGQLQLAADLSKSGGPKLLSPAAVAADPSSPAPIRNVLLALGLGLILGIGAAFLREQLDDSMKTKTDLEVATGSLPVLSVIPADRRLHSKKGGRRLRASSSPAAEAYRGLRTSILFMQSRRPLGTLQITSPSAGEGKTTTVGYLALAMAETDERVAIVCCDLRRPKLHEFFGASHVTGLTSLLRHGGDVASVSQRVPGYANLTLVPSGPLVINPSEVLSSPLLRDVIEELKRTHSLVIIDSPPVLPVTDALIISELVDATLLVTRYASTTMRQADLAIERLAQVNAPVIGSVFNGIRADADYARTYGGYDTLDEHPRRSTLLDLPFPERAAAEQERGRA